MKDTCLSLGLQLATSQEMVHMHEMYICSLCAERNMYHEGPIEEEPI